MDWADSVQKGGNLFEKGDFILYETVGVCQINEISTTDFSDSGKLYYHMTPKYESNRTICIPVDSRKVMMRGIMTRQEAEDFVLTWPDVACKKYSSDKERPQIYKQVFQSGSCLELASMIKEISKMELLRKGNGKFLTIREKNGISMARKLLFGELAAALDICPGDVPDYIRGATGCPC